MGRKSFDIIKNYSPAECARGFLRAVSEI